MLNVVRIIFALICCAIGWQIAHLLKQSDIIGIAGGLIVALVLISVEILFTKKFVSLIPVLMFGLIFGFLLAQIILNTLSMIPVVREFMSPRVSEEANGAMVLDTRMWLEFTVTFLMCYLGVIITLKCKDDFKFVIPFIEFSREGKSGKQLIFDTSVIVDGRITDICQTGIVDNPIIVPRFVLQELQDIADSRDRIKRVRGRRGLDMLNRMRDNKKLDLSIHEAQFPGVEGVDNKLVKLAKTLDARIVTTDFNLQKVAQLQGVEVINVNDIATALRPILLPGEELTVKLIRPGDEPGQGVGYLDDGTMVVVEEGKSRIGKPVTIMVTSVIQTSAGRMIFGKIK